VTLSLDNNRPFIAGEVTLKAVGWVTTICRHHYYHDKLQAEKAFR
jgi:hypothetical protein